MSRGASLKDSAAVDVLVGRIEWLLAKVQGQDLDRDAVGLHHHESLADREITEFEILAWTMELIHFYPNEKYMYAFKYLLADYSHPATA